MAKLSLLPFQDAYVSEWYADTNFGSSIALFVSQYLQPGDDYRSLLQFGLGQIPPSSTIEEAVLELTMYRNEVSGTPVTISAHRLLNRWNQFSVYWNNQPPAQLDIEGSVIIASEDPLGKVYLDLTKTVRGWYDGSIPNNGILLKGNEQMNDLVAFRSTNFADSNTWPLLQVHYVNGIVNECGPETLIIPHCPPYAPLEASAPIPLAPRKQATFLVKNATDCRHVKAMVQVSYSNDAEASFFDASDWITLKSQGYPGEAAALTTSDTAEYARVLVKGEGGETIYVWARTYEP